MSENSTRVVSRQPSKPLTTPPKKKCRALFAFNASSNTQISMKGILKKNNFKLVKNLVL